MKFYVENVGTPFSLMTPVSSYRCRVHSLITFQCIIRHLKGYSFFLHEVSWIKAMCNIFAGKLTVVGLV